MIFQVWQIINKELPNNTAMEFKENDRLGIRAIILTIERTAECSVRTDYENSFGYRAAQHCNVVPKGVKEANTLDLFEINLGQFLDRTPDAPPTPGLTTRNNNSLLEWSRCNLSGTCDGKDRWSPRRHTS